MAKKPRVRVSKNRKKNWNKVCDIKDVEEYLEEKRLDERIGGSVFEKTDDQLFVIQTDSKDDVSLKKSDKPLKCFSNIGSYTKVPPPIVISHQPYSKKIKNYLTRAAEKRNKKVAKSSVLKKDPVEKAVHKGDLFAAEIKDLWADEAKDVVDPEIEDLIKFRDEYTCKRTPKVPRHRFQKPSLLPAVEVPHSGSSYNPDFLDHQDLLREALKVEETKQREELHLKRVLTDMFPTKAEAPTQESILQEMSQGLFEEEDQEEESQTENILLSYNPPVFYENRLPKSKKRRKKEMKEKERLNRLEKLQRKRLNEVYRIKSLKSEIKKEATEIEKKIKRNLDRRAAKMYQPRTLSKHKYEAPDLEVNLSEEIADSLRTLKTEGNLLEDRYKSLQRRNLIEPRVKQNFKRKYKLKVQVKRSHRDFK